MSTNIPRSHYRKEISAKGVSINKENREIFKSNSLAKDKNNYQNNKGLSLKMENPFLNPTQVQKSVLNETKFKIHYDTEEYSRSRSRMQKNTTILHRARSSSNCQNREQNKKNNINSKLVQRSRSESRNIRSHNAQSIGTMSPHQHIPKTKHLSAEVKKRTFTSIEMWKDKMKKPSYYTGTMPKNLADKYPNVNIDKVHTKMKLRKSSVTEHIKMPQKSSNSQIKIDRKQNENIKESNFSWDIFLGGTVTKHLPNKVVPILQDNNLLNARIDNNNASDIAEQNDQLNVRFEVNSTTSITPLDGSLLPQITPTKVRYLKREVTHYNGKLSTKKEDIEDIHPHEYDYLEDVPYMEREREDNAPKLSLRFLKQSVNADQRRIIVGYLIHLGVHCEYSSNIIYQSVKLFDIAIDRILVETDNIQLMALACLWITLKRELTSHKIPSATTIVQMAKDLYTGQEKDLLMYEKKITSAVKFNLRFADPFSLLFYYILTVTRDSKYNINSNDVACIYFCGSYLLDVSMLDENLCDRSVCVLAITAAELSFCAAYSDNIDMDTWWQLWKNKHLLTEWEERSMSFTKQIIIRQALESDRFGSKIIYKKYLRNKRGRVSNFLLDKMRKLLYPMTDKM